MNNYAKNKLRNICFIDVETTGSNIYKDVVLNIGAVLVSIPNFEIIQKYESYIRPPEDSQSTDLAYSIHGIDIEELKTAPTEEQFLSEFFSKFGTNYSFGGWNVCFDLSFFRKSCFNSSYYDNYMKIDYRHLDVQSVARFLFEADKLHGFDGSMSSICQQFLLSRSEKHTGLQDALLTIEVYKKLFDIIVNG